MFFFLRKTESIFFEFILTVYIYVKSVKQRGSFECSEHFLWLFMFIFIVCFRFFSRRKCERVINNYSIKYLFSKFTFMNCSIDFSSNNALLEDENSTKTAGYQRNILRLTFFIKRAFTFFFLMKTFFIIFSSCSRVQNFLTFFKKSS